MSNTDIESLAADVKLKKSKVADYKRGQLLGKVSYDDLAAAGKELSAALFAYMSAKFPSVKTKRVPYQSLIR